MKQFKFWKKLNTIVKSKQPMQSAKDMLATGEISSEEMSWALVTLATIPLAMIDVLDKH